MAFFTDFWHKVKETSSNVFHHAVKPVWETAKKALPAAKQIALKLGAIPALLPAAEAVVLGADTVEAAIAIGESIGRAIGEAIG